MKIDIRHGKLRTDEMAHYIWLLCFFILSSLTAPVDDGDFLWNLYDAQITNENAIYIYCYPPNKVE